MSTVVDFPLSNRATRYIEQLSGYEKAIKRVNQDAFHEQINPDGIVNIGVAENILMCDVMTQKMKEIYDQHPIQAEDLNYTDFSGSIHFKTAVADMMGKFVFKVEEKLNPQHFVTFNGAGTIIEQSVCMFCDPGEAVLIPAPMYLAFERDIIKRFGCVLIPVFMPYDKSSNIFVLDMDIVKETLNKARSDGIRVKCFLLTTPSNPLGDIHTEEEIKNLIDFCAKEQLHLISDEVYALSIFDKNQKFTSAAQIVFKDKELNLDYKHVHIIYSLSKDFSLNGFRVGILYSRNEKLIASMRSISPFQSVSRHTQALLTHLLSDHTFIEDYVSENERRLATAYKNVTDILNSYNINYVNAKAGVLLWIDLSEQIKKKMKKQVITGDDEVKFFELMLNDAKVYIPCGDFFKCHHEPGWFRICFTARKSEFMQFAFEKVFKWLSSE
ncbi:1-aminocyclopropane-1-carboxylate synthase [Acrasis kona]|uniref:1-aminocyclopropane-1-carboxylate synthase n=1 Tax=Acrasis kona TaxID=1008807 RepID=A0AAW2YRT4_9EUKA